MTAYLPGYEKQPAHSIPVGPYPGTLIKPSQKSTSGWWFTLKFSRWATL